MVANPPFSYRWEPGEAMAEDMRFKNHGVAPKSAADFAFLLHGLHYLKDDGVMAIILPHGVLFRGGKEANIRTKLLKRSEEHTSELQSLMRISYAVFYLQKTNKTHKHNT